MNVFKCESKASEFSGALVNPVKWISSKLSFCRIKLPLCASLHSVFLLGAMQGEFIPKSAATLEDVSSLEGLSLILSSDKPFNTFLHTGKTVDLVFNR